MTETLLKILLGVFVAIFLALMITTICFTVYAFIEYGDKPITEIPSWAFWLMGGR